MTKQQELGGWNWEAWCYLGPQKPSEFIPGDCKCSLFKIQLQEIIEHHSFPRARQASLSAQCPRLPPACEPRENALPEDIHSWKHPRMLTHWSDGEASGASRTVTEASRQSRYETGPDLSQQAPCESDPLGPALVSPCQRILVLTPLPPVLGPRQESKS